ncbi:MAG TPA: penicillin-binding transpeptidase domain-containing protein, partial [Opitutaceae bacterium]
MSKGFTTNYRIALLASLVLAMFAGLGFRLIWLHVIDRDELLRSVDEARRQLIVDNARRGDILDDRGALLATSRSVVVLGVDPQFERPEDERKWPALAALLGMPLSDLGRAMTTKTRPATAASVNAPVAETSMVITLGLPAAPADHPAVAPDGAAAAKADETQLDDPDRDGNRPIRWAKLSDQVPESVYKDIVGLGIRGVYGSRVYRRDYPHNEMAAHLIGYVDKEERPIAGIEHYADFYLRGENGWLESEKDGKSRELAQFRTREVPPSDGFSVSLTIDATIQRMVEDELKAIAEKYSPEKATIIVSDPRTGFVLALANYPSFDLNNYNKLTRDDQRRMRNIAVADEYEPGSVFKIVAVSGALNDGLVTPQTEFD